MKRCKKWYTQPITIRWSGENNPKKQIPEGGKIVPVKTNWATREIPPVKIFLLHVKKTGKTRKSGREKNFPRVKKMGKMGKNGFHGHFWFSRGKKNTVFKYPALKKNNYQEEVSIDFILFFYFIPVCGTRSYCIFIADDC